MHKDDVIMTLAFDNNIYAKSYVNFGHHRIIIELQYSRL